MNIDQILNEAAIDVQVASIRAQERKVSTVKVRSRNQTVISLFVGVILIVGVGAFATGLLPTQVDPAQPPPTAGPVTFVSTVDLVDSTGTFVVTIGADVLGCSSGTIERTNNSESTFSEVMTCEEGSNSGTFTLYHSLTAAFVWEVRSSSGDFAGLQGEGNWDYRATGTGSAVETATGDIEYIP